MSVRKFEPIDCIHCDKWFGMPRKLDKAYQDNHADFYCPYCKGSMSYTLDETRMQRLERELKEARDELDDIYDNLDESKQDPESPTK